MDKELFKHYAELKIEAASIDMEIKSLQEQVLEAAQRLDPDHTGISLPDYGVFSVSARKVWKYTSAVDELKRSITERMAEEEATGDATYEERPEVRFTRIR